MALQVAPATTAGEITYEELAISCNGEALPFEEVLVEHGGRIHIVRCEAGVLQVHYSALLKPTVTKPETLSTADALVARRQSRYAPADVLEAFAAGEFGGLRENEPVDPDRARAIGEWVFERVHYEIGSSGPLDTAVDTFLLSRGVCRDFAHLTIAMCRAVGIPARLAAVYAPGLSPMDFHAVAEVAPNGTWEIVDATRLAPRQTLVRIATGRDAADTSFATTIDGSATVISASVTATTDRDLPYDDHRGSVYLA